MVRSVENNGELDNENSDCDSLRGGYKRKQTVRLGPVCNGMPHPAATQCQQPSLSFHRSVGNSSKVARIMTTPPTYIYMYYLYLSS